MLSLFYSLSVQLQILLSTCDAQYSGNILTGPGSCPNVVVKSTCKEIDEEAFYYSNLETIDCSPATELTRIGFRAFASCPNLRSVILPSSLKIIQSNAFYNCTALEHIDIPNNVEYIGVGAFKRCLKLRDISLPSSLKALAPWMFSECNSLTEVTIPQKFENLPAGIFAYCKALQKIHLHDKLYFMDIQCLYGCRLRKFVMPNSVETVSVDILSQNTYLEYIKISDSVHYTANSMATGIIRCYRIVLPANVISIGSTCFTESKIKDLYIPDSCKTIKFGAFRYCRNLGSIRLPHPIPTIEQYAFQGDQVCFPSTDGFTQEEINYLKGYATEGAFRSQCFDSSCYQEIQEIPAEISDDYQVLPPDQLVDEPDPGTNSGSGSGSGGSGDSGSGGSGSGSGGSGSGSGGSGSGSGGSGSGSGGSGSGGSSQLPKPSNGDESNQEDGSLTKGQVAGIAVGSIAGVALVVVGIFVVIRVMRNTKTMDVELDMSD